eukprot:1177830-Amorphochlora_amoeboformis.AAC.1
MIIRAFVKYVGNESRPSDKTHFCPPRSREMYLYPCVHVPQHVSLWLDWTPVKGSMSTRRDMDEVDESLRLPGPIWGSVSVVRMF